MIADLNRVLMSGAVASPVKNLSKDETKKWAAFKIAVTEQFSAETEVSTSLFDIIIFDKSNSEFALTKIKERDIVFLEGKLLVKMKKQKDGSTKQNTTIINGFGQTFKLIHSSSGPDLSKADTLFEDDELPF